MIEIGSCLDEMRVETQRKVEIKFLNVFNSLTECLFSYDLLRNGANDAVIKLDFENECFKEAAKSWETNLNQRYSRQLEGIFDWKLFEVYQGAELDEI